MSVPVDLREWELLSPSYANPSEIQRDSELSAQIITCMNERGQLQKSFDAANKQLRAIQERLTAERELALSRETALRVILDQIHQEGDRAFKELQDRQKSELETKIATLHALDQKLDEQRSVVQSLQAQLSAPQRRIRMIDHRVKEGIEPRIAELTQRITSLEEQIAALDAQLPQKIIAFRAKIERDKGSKWPFKH